jgi:hypothetical protein
MLFHATITRETVHGFLAVARVHFPVASGTSSGVSLLMLFHDDLVSTAFLNRSSHDKFRPVNPFFFFLPATLGEGGLNNDRNVVLLAMKSVEITVQHREGKVPSTYEIFFDVDDLDEINDNVVAIMKRVYQVLFKDSMTEDVE